MGDNHHLYRHIRKPLMQIYPQQLTGRQAQHMNTLSGMISGIVRSGKSQMRAMAKTAPDRSKVESRIKRFTRLTQNESVDPSTYFLPFLIPLLIGLARSWPLVLAIDGSEVGCHCLALVISVIYKKRALPLVWVVIEGSKGHFPEETHIQLVQAVKPCIPDGADVIFLGDGEFDGIGLQAEIDQNGWQYVCRSARNCVLNDDGDEFSLREIHLQPRECLTIPEVGFSQANYGPVLVVAWWHRDYQEPIFLVSNMDLAQEACHWYARRFCIETFFSDQKSRGFTCTKVISLTRSACPACSLPLAWLTFWSFIWVSLPNKRNGWQLSIAQTAAI